MRVTDSLVYLLTAMLAIPGTALPRAPSPERPEAPQESVPARAGSPAQSSPLQQVRALRILPLEGDHAINSIPGQSAAVPTVEVHDENDMPVEGATVVFQVPAVGPGAYFPDKKPSLSVVTNSRGQAVARGYRINSEPGRFSIRVTASYQNLTATYVLTQTNSVKAPEAIAAHKSHKWLWIGIAGAAAVAGGTAYALRSKSPHISASTGPIVISAP